MLGNGIVQTAENSDLIPLGHAERGETVAKTERPAVAHELELHTRLGPGKACAGQDSNRTAGEFQLYHQGAFGCPGARGQGTDAVDLAAEDPQGIDQPARVRP